MKIFDVPWFVLIAAIAMLIVTRTDAQSTDAAVDAVIRKAAAEFTEAFDRGDAESVASHFTADAVYINEQGQRFESRASIQQEYATLFKNASDLKLKLEIDSIRQVGATTVIEEGRTALTPQPPGSIRVISAYTAVHTLQDGKWLMAHVRDTRVELPPDAGTMEDLGWLVGTWSAERGEARVQVKGRWIENNRFLARAHTATESAKVSSTGLEIIGVDPSTGQITSWSFTSDGGHAVGRWAPSENGWIVESVGALGDGTDTYAIDSFSRKDDDSLVWKSVDRWVGESTLPDIQEVIMKRQ